MSDGQVGATCPQCGSAANVRSISDLAALAQGQLNRQPPGFPAAPQPGHPGYPAPPPQSPAPGWAAEPVPNAGPTPGWAAEPVPNAGSLPGAGPSRGRSFSRDDSDDPLWLVGEGLANVAMGAATKFIGRAIGQRVQRTLNDQVLPAAAAKRDEMLRTQIAIAERHPDLRACLTDRVVFLAGGNRALPIRALSGALTVEQSDQLVASLRNG